MPQLWDWLTKTDAGLITRVGFGAAFFLILAIADLAKNGSRAARWREYSFLLAAVASAMAYGLGNDLITCRISWEYFLFGKGLSDKLGSHVPPDMVALSREAAKIGLKASWTAGLIIGVALLMANNPNAKLARLSYRRLLAELPMVFLVCLTCAIMLGTTGYLGGLTWLSADFQEMTRNHEFRPERFIAVFGIHLGAYVGGAIGTTVAIIRIRQTRLRAGLSGPLFPVRGGEG